MGAYKYVPNLMDRKNFSPFQPCVSAQLVYMIAFGTSAWQDIHAYLRPRTPNSNDVKKRTLPDSFLLADAVIKPSTRGCGTIAWSSNRTHFK
ncbi:hypothetical protein AX14_001911 [Amanita brunnescens Koide BX004]|nr:hypothetical protein AX14_001911 [Amanita brunnescens Koide BX004]